MREVPPAPLVQLHSVTDAHLFSPQRSRADAARRMSDQLPAGAPGHLLCDGLQGLPRVDRDEILAWKDCNGPRLSPKSVLGEGLAAASAWQCVAAMDMLRRSRCDSATISIVGCNEQAIGAR